MTLDIPRATLQDSVPYHKEGEGEKELVVAQFFHCKAIHYLPGGRDNIHLLVQKVLGHNLAYQKLLQSTISLKLVKEFIL